MSQEIVVVCPLFTVKITGENERDLIKQASFWLSIPTKCPICKATLALDYRTPKTYKYYTLKCNGPVPHAVNFGQKQDDGSLYYDDKKQWEVFRPGSHTDEPGPVTSGSALPAPNTPPPAAPVPNVDPLASKRNDLIKLIQQAKNGGIRTNLNPPDVGRLSAEHLESETVRIQNLLNEGRSADAQN